MMQGEFIHDEEAMSAPEQATATPETAAIQPAQAPARDPVPAPESALVTDSPSLQPEPRVPVISSPIPPASAEEVAPAIQGHENKAQAIEKQLAAFIGARLTAEQAKGLTLDVVLANSNAVTGTKDHHDLALVLAGGGITIDQMNSILQQHPAFATNTHCVPEVTAVGEGTSLKIKYLNLDAAHIAQLLAAPVQQAPLAQITNPGEVHGKVAANEPNIAIKA